MQFHLSLVHFCPFYLSCFDGDASKRLQIRFRFYIQLGVAFHMHLLLKEIWILWYVFDTIDLQLISYFPKGRHCPTIFKASLKESAIYTSFEFRNVSYFERNLNLWHVLATIDLQLISYFIRGRNCPTTVKEKAPST